MEAIALAALEVNYKPPQPENGEKVRIKIITNIGHYVDGENESL